jgi:hypothetical protein
VSSGLVSLRHVRGESNVADLLTKALPGPRFRQLAQNIGICNTTEQSLSLCMLTTTGSFTPFSLANAAQMFLPSASTTQTVVNAINVVRALNELSKAKELVDLHDAGKRKPRSRRPSEQQCETVCAACLEQCGFAQQDEEQLGLLKLANDAGVHYHHGHVYMELDLTFAFICS